MTAGPGGLTLSNPRTVLTLPPFVHTPVMSPDETRIEFQRSLPPGCEICRVNLDGTGFCQLTQAAGDVVQSDDASWSLR